LATTPYILLVDIIIGSNYRSLLSFIKVGPAAEHYTDVNRHLSSDSTAIGFRYNISHFPYSNQVYLHFCNQCSNLEFNPMAANIADAPTLPRDESFAITADFNADTYPGKISLGAGVYRDENSKPWVLPSIEAVCK
jgi:hypothetical protein